MTDDMPTFDVAEVFPSTPVPENLLKSLDQLRNAVFSAIDEAATTGTLTRTTHHGLVLLAADVSVSVKHPSLP